MTLGFTVGTAAPKPWVGKFAAAHRPEGWPYRRIAACPDGLMSSWPHLIGKNLQPASAGRWASAAGGLGLTFNARFVLHGSAKQSPVRADPVVSLQRSSLRAVPAKRSDNRPESEAKSRCARGCKLCAPQRHTGAPQPARTRRCNDAGAVLHEHKHLDLAADGAQRDLRRDPQTEHHSAVGAPRRPTPPATPLGTAWRASMNRRDRSFSKVSNEPIATCQAAARRARSPPTACGPAQRRACLAPDSEFPNLRRPGLLHDSDPRFWR